MKVLNDYYNFGEKTTKDIVEYSFQLEGDNKDIDFIFYGGCPCTKGSYSPTTKKITGTLDLSMVGVNAGTRYKTKYIKVFLNPEEKERVREEGSYKAVPNPKKEILTLTIGGDVKFVSR